MAHSKSRCARTDLSWPRTIWPSNKANIAIERTARAIAIAIAIYSKVGLEVKVICQISESKNIVSLSNASGEDETRRLYVNKII